VLKIFSLHPRKLEGWQEWRAVGNDTHTIKVSIRVPKSVLKCAYFRNTLVKKSIP